MDADRLAASANAWVAVWQHGSAHPAVVRAALDRLAVQATGAALAAVVHAQAMLAAVPYGSVRPAA